MKRFCANLLLASLTTAVAACGQTTSLGGLGTDQALPFVAQAANAEKSSRLGKDSDREQASANQDLITVERTFTEGGATTTFTASGPSEQVNSLDPQNGITGCPDCQLASSVEYVSE